MNYVDIIQGLLSGGFMILGWFGRELWAAVKDLKEDLKSLRQNLSDQYVRKDDFRDFRRELLEGLQRIEDKLDNKQDK